MSLAPMDRPRCGRRAGRCLVATVAAVAALAAAPATHAKTFVIPHILDKAGLAASTPFTFDTTIFMTYAGGRAGTPDGGGVTADLYLFDQATSQPMTGGAGTDVCFPCSWALDSTTPSRSVVVEDLINAAGGFGGALVKLGFGVLVVSGDDAHAQVQGFVVNSHTNGFDISALMFNPKEYDVTRWTNSNETRRTWVIPHVLERDGTISNTQYTFDTTIFATYTAGIGDVPGGGGAEVQLYLYDKASGLPMRGAGGTDVCNPCLASLTDTSRKHAFNVDGLIVSNGGGFDTEVKEAFAIVVATGDLGGVELLGFVVNSHTSAFDVSVFGFTPEEVRAPGATAVDEPVTSVRKPGPMVGFPNPFNPRTTLAFELAGEQHVTLQIYDAAGRLVRTLLQESRPAGAHAVQWDGKDDAGQPLASGVYHAALAARDGKLNTKLVLLQ